MILFFTVDKQIITRRDNEKVVRDSQNYLYINFSFSEDWTGTKTAVFKGKSGNAFNVLIDENGSCLVPWEVLTEEYFEVSAFCGDLITANVVKVFTIESGYAIGEESRTPTPDIYTQIIARLSAIEAEIDPTAIQQVVDEYLSDKGYVTEQDVEQIVADYIEAHKDELKGDTGATGPQGPQGVQGPKGDTGEGVAAGGTTGQVLVKSSDANYDTEWGDVGTAEEIDMRIAAVNGIILEKGYKQITSEIVHKYINHLTGNLVDDNSAFLMEFSVVAGEKYRITGKYIYLTSIYGIYNGETMISTYPNTTESIPWPGVTETVEVTIPENATILRACSYSSAPIVEKYNDTGLSVDFSGNILYGKKWCACGDSFTAGDFTNYVDSEGHTGTESDAYDPISGKWKNYSWWISERNKMDVQLLAVGGNTFTNLEGATRPFSNPNTAKYNYTQIATDCDYITLQFGLNESNLTTAQIGTKTDTTNETLWGAYNVVLEAILTANPFAKIGIIISDAYLPQSYHDALIEIALYWGIPYLDLRNGAEVPMMIGGKLREHSSVAQSLRDGAFKISSTDTHPTTRAFEYRSTVIENFLRSL